eukprot:12530271-Ditylum_brightwellii.AAC.1
MIVPVVIAPIQVDVIQHFFTAHWPDPYYYAWSNEYYDFQGGCDQIAINNPVLQLQICRRPCNYYSTITEVGLLIKASGEMFHINTTDPPTSNITTDASITMAPYSGY